jgi:hypothetical protein
MLIDCILVATMLAAGILGGFVNFYTASAQWDAAPAATPPAQKPSLLQNVLTSVSAALLVPLFLNTISSTLLDKIIDTGLHSKAVPFLLIFLGFCLLAALVAQRFIQTLSQRVLQALAETKNEARQAKEIAVQVDKALDAQGEPEEAPTTSGPAAVAGPASHVAVLDDAEKALLGAMIKTEFMSRSKSGLVRDSKLAPELASLALASLLDKKLAAERVSRTKNAPQWYATAEGRIAYAKAGG